MIRSGRIILDVSIASARPNFNHAELFSRNPPHRHGIFITDDGYLISNYHVVKHAAKVRLLTGTGLIDATVVKVDAAMIWLC